MLELLVEKCIMGYVGFETLSPANALRRVFECVASGILLNGQLFFLTEAIKPFVYLN